MPALTNWLKRFYHTTGFGIQKLYSSLTHTIDESIERREINKRIKNFLKTKRILFITWFIYNLFIFHSVINKGSSSYEIVEYCIEFIRIIFIFSIVIVMFLYLYLLLGSFNRMVLKRVDALENYLRIVQPRLKNLCEQCSVTKCIRSFHCEICGYCVLRYELHSHWINRCIGGQNIYVYSVFLKSITFYFLTLLTNILLTIVLNQSVIFLTLLFIITMYLFMKFYLFAKKIFNNIKKNITTIERQIWRKLPYMWRSDNREFFNPFDKGIVRNKEEIYISYRYTIVENYYDNDTAKDNVQTETNLPEASVLDQSNIQVTGEDSSLSIKTLNKNDKFKIGIG
jgi:hypothetical protein